MSEEKIRVPTPPPAKKTPKIIPAGKVIAGRYRLEAPIGAGSMGMVYAAQHLQLRRKVAVKVLDTDLADIPNAALRFQREAQATSRLNHPNVAAATDYGRLEDGTMYLVLEYVDGSSLRRELEAGALPLPRALRVAEQIASALSAAHALDIVHRDLKPENVMLVKTGTDADLVKVLDFGIARVPQPDEDADSAAPLTRAGAVFGTPEYMAPEQAIGQRVDARADIYSLGVILFEMVAGVRPYEADTPAALLARQLTAPIPTFAERVAGIEVPRAFERVVQRLLGKRPAERYQNIADVIAVLAALRNEGAKMEAAEAGPLPAFELGTRLGIDLPADAAASAVAAQPVVLVPPKAPSLPPPSPVKAEQSSSSAGEPASPGEGRGLPRAARDLRDAFVRLQTTVRTKGADLLDRVRTRMPEPLQRRLSIVPRWVSLGSALLVLVVAITVLFVTTRSATNEPGPSAVASSRTPDVAASASASGARESATEVPPDEATNLVEQARTKLESGQAAEALSLVTRVLGKWPDRRRDERIATILFQTAISTNRAVADPTFALLQGTMAGNGAELLYWLSRDRGILPAARRRAEQIVASEGFQRNAPGTVRFAFQLQRADTCEKKRELLKTAAQLQGPIVLVALRDLTTRTGCGLRGDSDCFPCLRGDSALDDTIARLEGQRR